MSSRAGETRAFQGTHFDVLFARDASGHEPAREFFEAQRGERHAKSCKKVLVTVHLFASTPRGGFRDAERFKPVRDDIHEFRHDQVRLLCAFDGAGRLLLLHGVIKKKDALRPADIERAVSILTDHRAGQS